MCEICSKLTIKIPERRHLNKVNADWVAQGYNFKIIFNERFIGSFHTVGV